MNRPLSNLPCRIAAVALLLAAWIVATNHCGFGLMPAKTAGTALHAHCHGADSPAQKDAPGEARECCKSIQGTVVPERIAVKFDAAAFLKLPPFVEEAELVSGRATASTVAVFEHGPPERVSFAERVRQRCRQGNAPPEAA